MNLAKDTCKPKVSSVMNKIPVTKPFFDDEELELIKQSLDTGWVANGPKCVEFEKRIAEHEGVGEGIATTSCTTALHLAMIAEGMREGMDVIVPAFTFVATENSVTMTGATPVLVDVHEDTFNIDSDQVKEIIESDYFIEHGKLINKRTGNTLWGIVPVHEFGLCCNLEAINTIKRRYSIKVIEDAACALGAMYKGKHEGGFGNTSCVSFHPRKSITTGEGGMVLTDDSELAARMRRLRSHGNSVSAAEREKEKGFLLPEFNEAGFNYRMTDIQGGMGLAQAKKLDYIIEEKRKKAALYNRLIEIDLPELIHPIEGEGYFHTYQSYVCMLNLDILGLGSIEEGGDYRNTLLGRLEARGIATRQGTHAVHILGYYRNKFGYKPMDFPHAYACDRLSITLPLYVQMTDEDQKRVIDEIRVVMDTMKK